MRRTSYSVFELVRLERFKGTSERQIIDWIKAGTVEGYEAPSNYWRIPITELPLLRALVDGKTTDDPFIEDIKQRKSRSL